MAPDRRGPQEIGVGVGECTQEDNNDHNSKNSTEPLREELRRQATPEVKRHALQFANTLAYRVAARGGIGGALRAREMLYDALADTWLGSVHWDPNRKPLAQHLEDTLSWRARDAAQAAARTVFCGVFAHDEEADESDDEPTQDEGIPRMPISALPDIPQHEDDTTEPARLLAKLRRAAEHDEEVTAVLHTLQRHHTHQVRRAAMAMVPGMTLKRYHAAKARLMYLAKRCSSGEELHAGAERRKVSSREQGNRETLHAAPRHARAA